MTVPELISRFPEIPEDLHREPILSRFAETFDAQLRIARCPSNCAREHDAANRFYLKLIGPLSIYGYGLSTRERVLDELRKLLDGHRADPGGFVETLLSQ